MTKVVKIGDRVIGGGNPILIQSMTNTKTEDVAATVAQIQALTAAGCDIIRCAVPTMEAAEALTEIKKQVSIPVVADIHFEKAQDYAERFHTKPYASLEEMIEKEQPDVLHVCTPHYLHYKMITAAADAGKKVVCEKPITMTEEEFDRLAANYSDYGIFPIIQNRTNKCIRELKRLAAEDNTLGKLMGIKGEMTWCRGADYYNSAEWRGTKKYEGGGVLINQAVHTLDLMVYFGGRPLSVIASMSNNSLKGIIDVEDTVDARLEFESGTIGIFYATNAYSASPQPTLTLNYENAEFLYADGKLYKGGVKICEDESGFLGKRNWGSAPT